MKIGFISDVHSKKIALESVLEDMPTVDKLVCCGDVVGYGPWPSECVDIIKNKCDLIIEGNHDRQLKSPEDYKSHISAYEGLKHAKSELTDNQFDWVTTLPKQVSIENYLCVHSHPTAVDKYVYPNDFSNMEKYINEYNGMISGHTHIQAKEKIADNKLIFNPGSVGQPRDRDSTAAYAVLDSDKNNVELYRTNYDIEKVVNKIDECGLPERSGRRLRNGE